MRDRVVWTLLALLVCCGARLARAQEVFGSMRGTVTDGTGAAVAGARVSLAATAFATVSGGDGRYRIDHVPAGEYSVLAQLAEGALAEASVSVPAGGSVRLDLVLGSAGVAGRGLPAPITTLRADELASRTVISGALLDRLPLDEARLAFTLIPGVVLRDNDIGIAAVPDLSIRGGAPGEASVFVDGVPVRFETLGVQAIAIGASSVAEASVTTGVPGATVGDARGGVIGYVTRAGGPMLRGTLRADTDGPFGNGSSVGYNRFEGVLGGSLPVVPHLTWFVSGALQGQGSPYLGLGAAGQPTYVLGGADTTVQWLDFSGQTVSATLPLFVQSSGRCDAAGNSGSGCQGLWRPFAWSTLGSGQGKLLYSYGAGSSLTLTGLASDRQQRFFPGQVIGAPTLYQGARAWSRLAVLNWSQRLGGAALGGGALHLTANISIGSDRQISGPLDPASEVATRDPALGIELSPLKFTGLDSLPFPLTDQIIRNIRTNSGLRTPFLGRTDLRNTQSYRLNPYGMVAGWPTQGLDAQLSFVSERRLNGRWMLDWEARPTHRITLGTDFTRADVGFYTSFTLSQIFMDAFLVHPRRLGVFLSDRVELGDLVIDVGARYDHFSKGGEFSNTPGRIFTDPSWSPSAGTSDTAYENSVARVFQPTRAQGVLSPRLRLAYVIAPHTSVRFGYGEQVAAPPVATQFASANSDLSFTNTNRFFGRDVRYEKTRLIEIGGRHELIRSLTLDVSLYDKNHLAPYAPRIRQFDDPAVPGDLANLIVLTAVDGGHGTGIDVRLDGRPGGLLSGTVAYSFLRVHGDDVVASSTHAVSALAALRVPSDWGQGTFAGAAAREVTAHVAVRLTNGLPYTRLQNTGAGILIPNIGGALAEPFNASRLPWITTLDLRFGKGFRTGRLTGSLFADFRNLLDFTNTLGAYAETGGTANDLYRQNLLAPEYSSLRFEAQNSGALLPDGSTVDLRGCATWQTPINCVALGRVERRFGDGDGLYTRAEQDRAFNTYYDAFFGPWQFHGHGRTVRVGVQLGF